MTHQCPACTKSFATAVAWLAHRVEWHGWTPKYLYNTQIVRILCGSSGYAMVQMAPRATPVVRTYKQIIEEEWEYVE